MRVKFIHKTSLVVNAVTFNYGDELEVSETTYNTFKQVFEVIAGAPIEVIAVNVPVVSKPKQKLDK